MSFRGGRGGGNRGGIKGATWEQDATIKLDTKPSEKYPRHPNLKRPSSLTPHERTQVKYYRTLRDKVHRGPLYTHSTRRDTSTPVRTFGEDQFNQQYGREKKADFDPFLGVETYSMRYERKKRAIPLLSGRSFNKEFFPKELWPVLDEESEPAAKRTARKNALAAGVNGVDQLERTKALMEKIEKVTGVEGAEGEADEELEEEEEEEQDYNYEDDEDEMGGDYDGEQYFENGEEDDDDGGDGGGGDDY